MSSVGVEPGSQVHSRPASSSPKITATRACLYSLLLVVLCFALYYPARHHPFVNYDDNLYVTDNEHVKDGLTWDTVTWSMTTFEAGNWHPLTWLSHAWDYQLYGSNPAGHHETSLLLHAVNAVLVFWVLLMASGYAGRSLMVAALFAVHPINVESVVWVAERKTVLSMMFFLLALGAYGWYASSATAARPMLVRGARYALVALLFALGLMAKPQVITFPFVLLLWDYWPLERCSLFAVRSSPEASRETFWRKAKSEERLSGERRTANSEGRSGDWRWLFIEKLPLFAIAAGSAVLTMQAQGAGNAVLTLSAVPLSIRLSNAIVSYVRYLGKIVWPLRLAPMYPHPGGSLRPWQVYGALLVLLAITMWVVEERRRRRYLLVGWFWFLGTLVPMIGLVQVGRQAMADRYAYLPLLGVFIMICWGVADAAGKRVPAQLLPVAGVAVVLLLSVVARRQIGYWADNLVLWTHTIAITPPNYVAQDNLGATLLARKRDDEAIVHFRLAAAIHPTDPISAFNIGVYEQAHGQLREAIEQYKQAIMLTTRSSLQVLALRNMGRAYSDLGENDQARQCFDEIQRRQAP